MNALEQWRNLRDAADAFRQEHLVEIERAISAEAADHIRAKLPDLLERGLQPWCRNGSVCSVATPCENLSCEYKEAPTDVLVGVPKCRAFQLTVWSPSWETARHVAPFGSVDMGRAGD